MQAFAGALRLAPGDAAAHAGVADLLQSAGRAAEAHAVRAHYFRAKGLPIRAIQEYEAMARSPAYRVPAVMEMGLILLETRQKGRAIQVTKAALALHPRDPALYERMVVLELMWDHIQAQRWCEQWRQLEPRSIRPLWLMGRIRADRGDLARATQLLQKVVDAEPENMDYAVTLAEVLLRFRDRAEMLRARKLLERAVTRPSADAKTYADLGQALERLGEPEAARRAFLRSLDLDANVSDPYVSLVRLARQLGQPEQIERWGPIVRTVEERLREETLLSRRTWEAPDDPAGHRDLALHFLRNAELRKAESQLEEALRLRPGSAEARQWLARVRRTREVL
jgi:Tfp pilus assembly protein PilF